MPNSTAIAVLDANSVQRTQSVEKAGGGEVTIVSMGSAADVSGIRTALAMGAAKAVVVSDDSLRGTDALGTAKVLAAAIKRINPDFDRSWVRGTWLFKDRAGQPIVHYRYHEVIPDLRTPTKGLYLANTTQIYPEDRGQNYAIRLGKRVAQLAMEDVAQR